MKFVKKTSSKAGFTLTEVIIAGFIGVLVLGMVATFFVSSLRALNASYQRINLGYEICDFTNQLTDRASKATQFIVYKTVDPTDFDGINAAGTAAGRLFPDREGESTSGGDFAVFVTYEIPKPTAEPVHRIARIDGYYLGEQNATTKVGSVTHLSIDFGGAPSRDTVEKILKDCSGGVGVWRSSGSAQVTTRRLFPMVRPMAKVALQDGVAANAVRLFYRTMDRNLLISGQHYSANGNKNTNDLRTYTNVFSFNVTERN